MFFNTSLDKALFSRLKNWLRLSFLLCLCAAFLDRPDREEQVQRIVGERNEAILGVELLGFGIGGHDFHRKQAKLFGQFQTPTQGMAQERPPKPLAF
jgi:hypothetical protein